MNDNVERFLTDAEKCARNGERELAYSLLELALLNAPDEPEVFARVEKVRALISSDIKAQVESEKSTSLPELPSFAPILNESVAEKRGDDGDDMYAHWYSDSGTDMGIEEDLGEEEEGRSKRMPLLLSLVVLFVTVLAAGAYVINPQGAANLVYYQQVLHPVDKAKNLQLSGDIDAAVSELERVTPRDERVMEALLLKAEILTLANDEAQATRAWQEIVIHPEVTWRELLRVARWYFEKGDVRAKDVYMLAFERGAPAEHWLEVAKAQASQGNTRGAAAIYQLIMRKLPDDSAAAATELKSLRGAGF